MFFMYDLLTETLSNYSEKSVCSVADFMPFCGKCNIMDPPNLGPRSDDVITNFVLYWSLCHSRATLPVVEFEYSSV